MTAGIAFYAPLKPPDHATPSGDRTVARLLLEALRRAGFAPEVASSLRARVTSPDERAQRRLQALGAAEAERLIALYRRRPPARRPRAWLTYHLYYKAVDWIGPSVAAALDIPYVIAEASHAPKRASGPFAFNHRGTAAAIRQAAAILCLNPADKACLAALVPKRVLVDLPPFLDLAAFAPRLPDRAAARAALAERYRLDPALPWLLAVAMMREGDKLASYEILATALARLSDDLRDDFRLLLVGDGPARLAVARAMQPLGKKIRWIGKLAHAALPRFYAAADLAVWPAVNEAFGMALLEAQACGCPVVAGASGGVPAIVGAGFLAPPGDAAAFAAAVARALGADPAPLRRAARARVIRRHDIGRAQGTLRRVLARLGIAPA